MVNYAWTYKRRYAIGNKYVANSACIYQRYYAIGRKYVEESIKLYRNMQRQEQQSAVRQKGL